MVVRRCGGRWVGGTWESTERMGPQATSNMGRTYDDASASTSADLVTYTADGPPPGPPPLCWSRFLRCRKSASDDRTMASRSLIDQPQHEGGSEP